MGARNQADHAKEILRYFSEARKEEFPDFEILGNAFGLLARFVVLSESQEILRTTNIFLKNVFEDARKAINGILENDFDGTSSYIISSDYGQLSSIQNIGKENISLDIRRFVEFSGRRKKRSRGPFITPPDIPKLHQLYYGFTQKCSNPLDLLVIQMKTAGVISYCLGKSDPWLQALDVFTVSHRPDFDNIDEKNVKILKNWCSLVRAAIAGNFFTLKTMDSELRERTFGIFVDFALDHCEACLILDQTLQLIKEDASYEALCEIKDALKLSLCRCISQGVIQVFYTVKCQSENPLNDERQIGRDIFHVAYLICLWAFVVVYRLNCCFTKFGFQYMEKN